MVDYPRGHRPRYYPSHDREPGESERRAFASGVLSACLLAISLILGGLVLASLLTTR